MATVVWEQGMAWHSGQEKPTLRSLESKAKSQAGGELGLPGPPGFLSGSCASNHSLLPTAVIKKDGSEGRRKRAESVYLRKAIVSRGGSSEAPVRTQCFPTREEGVPWSGLEAGMDLASPEQSQ